MRKGFKLTQVSYSEGHGVELSPTEAPPDEGIVMVLFNEGYTDDLELALIVPGSEPVPLSLVEEFIAEARTWLRPPKN
jgi:hypothetical protein